MSFLKSTKINAALNEACFVQKGEEFELVLETQTDSKAPRPSDELN